MKGVKTAQLSTVSWLRTMLTQGLIYSAGVVLEPHARRATGLNFPYFRLSKFSARGPVGAIPIFKRNISINIANPNTGGSRGPRARRWLSFSLGSSDVVQRFGACGADGLCGRVGSPIAVLKPS